MLTLITKIGGRESNSFVSVAEADLIIADLPDDATEWNALSENEKAYRLILAANLMAMLPLKGRRSFEGQALCFPRLGMRTIPDEVKQCQVFLAYSVVHRGLANRPESVSEAEGDRVSQVSLGGLLMVTFAGSKSKKSSSFDQLIASPQFPAYAMMQKWLASFRGGSVSETNITLLTTTTTV